MGEQTFGKYKSRRNNVSLVQTDAGRFVIKTFLEEGAFQKELYIYRLLQDKDIPCAKVIHADNKTLTLTELPGRTLVDCLEEQEQTGFPVWGVWEKLVVWLTIFRHQTGFVMTDVNLRNFLYDEESKILYGLDFEECCVGSLIDSVASVAAFIRTYAPENTPLKQEISEYVLQLFAQIGNVDLDRMIRESANQEVKILERRQNKV